jgi:hypothetical protein
MQMQTGFFWTAATSRRFRFRFFTRTSTSPCGRLQSIRPEGNHGSTGSSRRRFFYGPGINNFDLNLQKALPLTESKSVELRVEMSNSFNHAQFYGTAAVNGDISSPINPLFF